MATHSITVNTLRVEQRKDTPIYVFGVNGRVIGHFASVSFAERSKTGTLRGYQRRAVKKHIREILEYLSEEKPLLPNAIIVAFDGRVKFTPINGHRSEWGTFGRLEIPMQRNAAETKVGFIVDGQQRVEALSKLDARKHFPVVVVGFESDSPELQREQFLLVNKTKPLPRDLVNEILPGVSTKLPRDLEKRRVASKVLEKLRFDEDSPFYGRVRGLDEGGENCNISQAALLAVIQNSIRSKGILFDYFAGSKGKHDLSTMAKIISIFFEGVRRVWPEAWAGNPATSRLVHGAGIYAVGHLMDRIMPDVDPDSPKAASMVENRLERMKRYCAWTSGRWPSLGCKWNELQNTSQDKSRLTEHLLKAYRQD